MSRSLGGPDKLVETFQRQLAAAPRGSEAALIWFRSFFRLREAGEHNQADAFSRMTTQQLEDMLARTVECSLQEGDATHLPAEDQPV
jgi:hypothetical protein